MGSNRQGSLFSVYKLIDEIKGDEHIIAAYHAAFGKGRWVSTLHNLFTWLSELEEPERTGSLFNFVNSQRFRALCTLVIVFNGIVASVAVDEEIHNGSNEDQQWTDTVEIFFLIFYAIEIGMKLVVHRGYFFVNDEAHWNNFDLLLVVLGLYDFIMLSFNLAGETNLTFARLGRLLKLSRLLRIFRAIRFFSALRQMLASVVQSLVMLFWAMAVLLMLWWTLGLVLLQGFASILHSGDLDSATHAAINDKFGTIPRTIFTLFSLSTGGEDWESTYKLVTLTGDFYAFMLIAYISFFTFSLFNILTGIVVEHVIANTQLDDSDRIVRYRQRMLQQGAELKRLFVKIDVDNSGFITEREMIKAMQDHEILAMMEELKVDPRDAQTFHRMLCQASKVDGVDVGHFIDGFMQMRGSAAGVDVQILRCQVDRMLKCLNQNKQDTLLVKKLLESSDAQAPMLAQAAYVDRSMQQLQWLLEDGFRQLHAAIGAGAPHNDIVFSANAGGKVEL